LGTQIANGPAIPLIKKKWMRFIANTFVTQSIIKPYPLDKLKSIKDDHTDILPVPYSNDSRYQKQSIHTALEMTGYLSGKIKNDELEIFGQKPCLLLTNIVDKSSTLKATPEEREVLKAAFDVALGLVSDVFQYDQDKNFVLATALYCDIEKKADLGFERIREYTLCAGPHMMKTTADATLMNEIVQTGKVLMKKISGIEP